MLKPIEVKFPFVFRFLPKKTDAITLFPFIFYRKDVDSYRKGLRAHERYHWDNALRWGVLPFYVIYVVLLLKYGGGENHPLEKPAYELQRKINAES